MSEVDPRRASERRAIATPAAPAAIGPYSQAVSCGDLVFVSGQIPLDPTTGLVVDGGTAAQTRQVLSNLSAILAAANLSFAHVVKATIYLVDLRDFDVVNTIYAEFVRTPAPARATVQVARLPRDARIEIDLIAAR